MNNKIEKDVAMVLIDGETANEIAQNYAKICNNAYSNCHVAYSQNAKQIMKYAPIYVSMREIKGKYFAEIESGFYETLNGETDEADS